uniref:Mediator complex subunit 23 n=1 Tax=Panagrellus redivivus TaxID=6233 RepID=A0A7E4V2J6_PANRE
MASGNPVYLSIINGTITNDIRNYPKAQVQPFLPYLLTLTFSDRNDLSPALDALRGGLIEHYLGNTLCQYFELDYTEIFAELSKFDEDKTIHFPRASFHSLEPKDKVVYICKELLALSHQFSTRMSATERRDFEPFDQDLLRDEVVGIITVACQRMGQLISLSKFVCFLLYFRHGAQLIKQLVMNQPHNLEQTLTLFRSLNFGHDSPPTHVRNDAIFELLQLDQSTSRFHLRYFLESEDHFVVANRLLCSDLVDDDLFITTGASLFSQTDDKFLKFLVKAPEFEVDKVYKRLYAIAKDLPNTANDTSVNISIFAVQFLVSRIFRNTRACSVRFLLEFIASRETDNDGYLMSLVCVFITTFAVGHITDIVDIETAKNFFEKLRVISTTKTDSLTSFNEFLLLLAIHFQSGSEDEVKKLLGSSLGCQITCPNKNFHEIGRLFLKYVVTERDIAEIAARIEVTPRLSQHIHGHLPVHCIDYLLNNQAFSKHSISIESWVQRQLLECRAPIHPVMVNVIRKYALSCVPVSNTRNYNTRIDEKFFITLFSKNVFTDANPTPYLLAFYYIAVFNSYAGVVSTQSLSYKKKPYSQELIDLIPIRKLLALLDETPEQFSALRNPLMILVADNLGRFANGLDDAVGASKDASQMGSYSNPNLLSEFTAAVSSFHLEHLQSTLSKIAKLPNTELTAFIEPFVKASHKLLDVPHPPKKLIRAMHETWLCIECVVPQRLYEETLKVWFSTGDEGVRNATVDHAFMVAEPSRVFRVDERILKRPSHFRLLIPMLDFYLLAAHNEQKVIREKHVLKLYGNQRAINEVIAMQASFAEAQCCATVQLLLEICDEEINPTPELREIRQIAFAHIHKMFLVHPHLIHTVHLQGYPIKYIPLVVEHVPACYAIIDRLEDLLRYRNLSRRIFTVTLIAHLLNKFTVTLFTKLTLYIHAFIVHETEQLDNAEKIVFIYNVLPALEIIAKRLPFMKDPVLDVVKKGVAIAQCRAAIQRSLTAGRRGAERILINEGKAAIARLNEAVD